jgi:E3 ubiquitin-protein ligase BRE1
VLSGEKLDASSGDPDARGSVPASLLFEDSETFRKHLSKRKDKIVSSLSDLFAKYPPSSPEVAELQQQLSSLLANEKEHIVKMQRVAAEKQQMSDRLDTATRRYLVAEKKIDRIKSAQVLKLEQQAVASSTAVKEETPLPSNGVESTNGKAKSPSPANEEVETAKNQAVAEAARRREQLEQVEQENKKLTEETTSLKIKFSLLSDDDYAKTDLFKALKSQHEDVIKRINNLEATNIQLREEAQKYQAERTAYRIKIDDEARSSLAESESAVSQAEANLARIRAARDELLAKNNVLESGRKTAEASTELTKEMAGACESRIAALESECERLRLQIAENVSTETEQIPATDETSEQLQKKITNLETQLKLLSGELPSMEAAWKKAQTIAGKKIIDVAAWEENIARANADKSKADQKFFAAMKAKGELEQQVRALRLQTTKSTEVVSQLKDADALSRSLVDKLEKQTAEMKTQMDELSVQHRQLQQKVSENAITSDAYVSQIAELKKTVEAKDTTCLAAKHAQRESETERDALTAQVAGLKKQVQSWKKKSTGDQSTETATMEQMLQCQICKSRFKNTVIKTCGHLFCDQCVQDRLTNRARKCPNCGKAFGNNDTMKVHL